MAPDDDTVVRLLTKDGLDRAAREHGIPAPRTFAPSNRSDVEAAAAGLDYPVILKPTESEAWKAPALVELLGSGTKILSCGTPAELLACYDRIAAQDPGVVIQDMIPGEDERLVYSCFYVSRAGELLGLFSGRKLRVLPPGRGSASFVESMEDPALTDATLELVHAVGYRGLGGIEFKLDPRDDTYKLIEVNVRFGLWDALGSRCGSNLAYIAYRDALGLPVQPALRHRTGVKWISIKRDWEAFDLYREQGLLTTTQWLWSLRGKKTGAVFAWDDPKPAVTSTSRWLRGRLPGLWRRLASSLGLRKRKGSIESETIGN